MTEEQAGDLGGSPGGLLHGGRRNLKIVTCLYIVIATLGLAIPALMAQPRGQSPHQISETNRTNGR